ncbi:MAG: carbohydrate ABC transporter permease [Cellulosilyticaceae bacterium]
MVKKLQRKQQRPLVKEQKHTWQSKKKSELGIAVVFLLPSLLGVLLFVLIPFVDVVRRSFFSAMSGVFVGTRNYSMVWQNEAFKLAGLNTIKFISVCIPLLVMSSLFLALLVNGITKKSEFFKTTFLVPMAVPVASVVLVWQVFFHQNGLLSKWMIDMGGKSVDWMNTGWAFWILVGSYIWRNIGYDMVLWLAGLSTISPDIYEAAKVDGAGRWQCFTKMTLPNLMPTFFIIVVLSLLNSFKVFREAYLVAGDYPHDSMYMLQHLFNNWFTSLDIDKLSAAATIVAIVILVFILLLQKAWGSEEES